MVKFNNEARLWTSQIVLTLSRNKCLQNSKFKLPKIKIKIITYSLIITSLIRIYEFMI